MLHGVLPFGHGRTMQVVAFGADERYRLGRPIEYCDCYHSANRYSVSTGNFPIVLPRTIGWSYLKQRLLLGTELMLLQGHSVPEEHDATESQLGDMAGNAQLGSSSNKQLN